MNMSDDVSSAVLGVGTQAAQKGIETMGKFSEKVIDNIAKLLAALFKSKSLNQGNNGDVKSSDMTDLKSGEIGIKELIGNARKNGDTIISTDGYSKEDVQFLKKKSKEYGMPLSFTNTKSGDNTCAHIRGSDKAIFERIGAEMIQDKLSDRPQELDNFKAKKWEINGIQHELSRHDLNANWGKTKDGEYFCIFEKVDKKAVMMARNEFMRKCDEVKKDLTITKSDDGFYTIKDEISGKAITFDNIPDSKNELSEMFRERFGYDENKAEIACGKFAETHLDGELKKDFLSDNPQNEFSKIESHIELKGEHILAKDYDCLRLTPTSNGVPLLVFKDEQNNFAVLNPGKMTRKEMSEQITHSLGVKDDKTISALVDKAEKVNDFYTKQNAVSFSHSREFSTKDFDFANLNPDIKMERESKNGAVFEKSIPVSRIGNEIERLNKDVFTVSCVAEGVEYSKGEEFPYSNRQELILSFSDKKSALTELQAMYEKEGVPPDIAKNTAKEVFAKAKAQSAEKVFQIEEIKVDKSKLKEPIMTVKCGNQTEEINLVDRDNATSEISEKFDVSGEEAEALFDKASEIVEEEIEPLNLHDENISGPEIKNELIMNGHEKNPAEDIDLNMKPEIGDGAKMPEIELPKGRSR